MYVGELERASRGTIEVAMTFSDHGHRYVQNVGFMDRINKGTKTGRSRSSPRVFLTLWFNRNTV